MSKFAPSTQPSQDRSYVVRPQRRVSGLAPSTQAGNAWHEFESNDSCTDSQQSATDQPIRRQHERQRQDLRWQEQLPLLLFHRHCWLAKECDRWQQVHESLHSEFSSRVVSAVANCFHCDALHSLAPTSSAAAITPVFLEGHIQVQVPQYSCSECHKTLSLHPGALGCFPASPSRAEIWYDQELLASTSASQH